MVFEYKYQRFTIKVGNSGKACVMLNGKYYYPTGEFGALPYIYMNTEHAELFIKQEGKEAKEYGKMVEYKGQMYFVDKNWNE
jgi:hypothetical protein